jgi:signal recognition particle GTPase
LNLPVKFIGTGETIDDVEPFEPGPFVEAMFAVDAATTPASG